MTPFSDPLIRAGLHGLPSLFRAGYATPAGVFNAYIDRIRRLDASLGAYVWFDPGASAAAHASCERWRSNRPLSALDGCPVGVKANIAVYGAPWHAGIGGLADRVATRDAVCIARLRQAGAVILGLLNMDEGAFGAATDNAVFGRTQNPWKPGHTPGGSSGGAAAAVAAQPAMISAHFRRLLDISSRIWLY